MISQIFRLNSILLICLMGLFCTNNVSAQQYVTTSVSMMHYNVLNYGLSDPNNCQGLLTYKKHEYLKTILKYAEPDILGLVKMIADSNFVKDTIVTKVLDSVCLNCYQSVEYANQSGYFKSNNLYFKKSKFGYIYSKPLHTGDSLISDIRLHRLYYKDSISNILGDTVYLNIIQCHLLSGDQNASIRGDEIKNMLDSLQSISHSGENHIILGDFNSRKAEEPCIDYLIHPADSNWNFYHPENQLGNWDSLPSQYVNYLTISTRVKQLDDCGANGGMDDVYDHIFINKSVKEGLRGLTYTDSSYHVLGQDGLHLNKGLLDKPKNTSAPSDVISALYYMSNHLPVSILTDVKKLAVYSGQITGPSEVCLGDLAQLELKGNLGKINWLFLNKGTWTPWPYSNLKFTVSPNKDMSFRVVADSMGLFDTSAPFDLKVILPTAKISTSGGTSFCEGDSLELMVDLSKSYLWNTGEVSSSIWVKKEGTYWVKTENFSGCFFTDSIQITMHSLPDASFTYQPIQSNGIFQFYGKDTTLVKYNWDFGDGIKGSGDTISHQFALSNTYTVILETKDSNGCVNSSSKQVDVSLGIQSFPHLAFVDVNPNPFVGHTFLRYMLNAEATIKISLLDVSGKSMKDEIIHNQTLGTHYYEVIVPNPGVYFIQLNMGGNTFTFKLVAL